MRFALLIFVCFVACIGRAAEVESRTKPDAGGVLIEPSEGEIAPGTTLTFTFPAAMIRADQIDTADQALPFVSQPRLEGEFLWKSPTEGVFTVRGVVPGTTYRLTLAPQLADGGLHG